MFPASELSSAQYTVHSTQYTVHSTTSWPRVSRPRAVGLRPGRHLRRARHSWPARDIPLLLAHLRRGPSRCPRCVRYWKWNIFYFKANSKCIIGLCTLGLTVLLPKKILTIFFTFFNYFGNKGKVITGTLDTICYWRNIWKSNKTCQSALCCHANLILC